MYSIHLVICLLTIFSLNIIAHKSISDGASITFNYVILLLTASVIAGLGLVSNSVAFIIASMLVSPIMGPVVGLAYGCSIMDWKLVRKSLRNECLSLVFCIVSGLVIAAITGPTAVSDTWPTPEMANRGDFRKLLSVLARYAQKTIVSTLWVCILLFSLHSCCSGLLLRSGRGGFHDG